MSFAGVDTLAVSPDGAWALAGNPTHGGTNVLSLVNLSTFAVSPLDASLQYPVGVSFVRTPGFHTQVTTGPTDPVPVVGSTVTCLITVTNTGYQALNPIRLNLCFDCDYLAYAGGTPAADAAGAHMLIWTNVGPLAVSGWTVVTAQFTALRQTMPETMITVTSTARTAFGLLLVPQTSSVPVRIANSIMADFDGDRLADPFWTIKSNVPGIWTLWLSSGGYLPSGPYIFTVPGGVSLTGDFDGDGISDPVMIANGGWTLWLSSGDYLPSGPYIFAVAGGTATPMASDFDGDWYADPVMVLNNNWTFWFSSGGYLPSGPYLLNP